MPFRFIRRWVRRTSKPINVPTAELWKRRLSVAYGFLAWNALAMVGYAWYKGKRDWAEYYGLETSKDSPAEYFSKSMDIAKAKVIRIDGFRIKEEFEIDNTGVFDERKKI